MRHRIRQLTALVALATGVLCLGANALAQERHGPPGPGFRLDERYHHDHYYPPRGYAVPVLPRGAISVTFGGGNYFFHGGVWFRPFGGRFVVTVPPIGVFVPILPPAYVTLPMPGGPVYYANGVYYAPAPGQGYTVIDPPPGADSVQPMPPPPPPPAAPMPPPRAPDPIIYPRNGQSPAQLEADRQDCNRWATTQPNAVADASVFQRAVAACLDGRGYTVR